MPVDAVAAELPDGGTGEERPSGSSISAALDIVGDRWTILILRDAFRGIRRFDQLRRDLEIPRAVLADRLRRLVEHGVLVKRRYQDRPARYEYRLTRMGIELSPILVALMQWGDRWLTDGAAPVQLVHEPCGSEIHLELHCWTCGEDFPPTEITSRPGPGVAADTSQDRAPRSTDRGRTPRARPLPPARDAAG